MIFNRNKEICSIENMVYVGKLLKIYIYYLDLYMYCKKKRKVACRVKIEGSITKYQKITFLIILVLNVRMQ